MLDKNGNKVDVVYYGHLKSNDGSIVHSGDNLTGEGEGDDEVITVHLDRISANVDSIWPIVNIYTDNRTFYDVEGAYCRIVDSQSG